MISKNPEVIAPINLQVGWPTPALHPDQHVREATAEILSTNKTSESALMYGMELGYEPLRVVIGQWLTELYNPSAGAVTMARVGISNGASGGLTNIIQKFTDPFYTRTIWMVEPTYFLACPVFKDAGFEGRLRGVPEDDEGVDLEFLESALEKSEEDSSTTWRGRKTVAGGYQKIFKHIIYCVPTFSNPSAKTMSLRRRQDLIRLARKYDALIISDDVYDVLRWPAEESLAQEDLGLLPPRLVDIDRAMEGCSQWGNSVSNSSFAKIAAPGMKVGWFEGTPSFVAEMAKHGSVVSGGCYTNFAAVIIERMLSKGALQGHINNVLIPTYRRRYYTIMAAIKEHLFPLGVTMDMGTPYRTGQSSTSPILAGGYFLYVRFPDGLPPVAELAELALKSCSLRFAPGALFIVQGDAESHKRAQTSFGQGARLSWAWNEEDVLVEGIQRLASVIEDALARAT